jgi:hypothetical protein
LAKASKLFLDEADEIIIVKKVQKHSKLKTLSTLKLLSLVILKRLIEIKI